MEKESRPVNQSQNIFEFSAIVDSIYGKAYTVKRKKNHQSSVIYIPGNGLVMMHILFIFLENALIWVAHLIAKEMDARNQDIHNGDGNPEIVIFPGMQNYFLHLRIL